MRPTDWSSLFIQWGLFAWWFWRSAYTRSHPELGREMLQRRWYFVLRRGRVGRCQAYKPHGTCFEPLPFYIKTLSCSAFHIKKIINAPGFIAWGVFLFVSSFSWCDQSLRLLFCANSLTNRIWRLHGIVTLCTSKQPDMLLAKKILRW